VVGGASPTRIAGLFESVPISTAAIAAAPSAAVYYSTTARASVAFRILGYVEYSSGLATAGVYISAPTLTQVFGPGVSKPGDIVQRVHAPTGAYVSGTTTIPADDTIPQITEGVLMLTASITPAAAVNVLGVDASLVSANDTIGVALVMTAALFRDSTADAVAVTKGYNGAANNFDMPLRLGYQTRANATSPTTFSARLGVSAAGTVSINGRGGFRLFGGVANSFIDITEVMA
jgi:hypothetical protein